MYVCLMNVYQPEHTQTQLEVTEELVDSGQSDSSDIFLIMRLIRKFISKYLHILFGGGWGIFLAFIF